MIFSARICRDKIQIFSRQNSVITTVSFVEVHMEIPYFQVGIVDYRYRLWLIPHVPMWPPSALHCATFSMIYISAVSQTLCWWRWRYWELLRSEKCVGRGKLYYVSQSRARLDTTSNTGLQPPLILQYCLVWSLHIRLLIEPRPVNCHYLYKVLSLSWGRQRTD